MDIEMTKTSTLGEATKTVKIVVNHIPLTLPCPFTLADVLERLCQACS